MFEDIKLNEVGTTRVATLATQFSQVLMNVELHVPPGRELALVKTKLEEAFFYARQGVESVRANQAKPDAE